MKSNFIFYLANENLLIFIYCIKFYRGPRPLSPETRAPPWVVFLGVLSTSSRVIDAMDGGVCIGLRVWKFQRIIFPARTTIPENLMRVLPRKPIHRGKTPSDAKVDFRKGSGFWGMIDHERDPPPPAKRVLNLKIWDHEKPKFWNFPKFYQNQPCRGSPLPRWLMHVLSE